jgi:hypothetical protein
MRITATAVIGLVVACAPVWGQGTAQMNGTVKDSSGLAVQGAEVKATQTATGASRTAASGADGSYALPNLPIGPYMLEITKEGFSKYIQSGIVLQVDANVTVDAALKIGSVNEQVTVQADAAMVETHSTGVGTVVDNQRVVEMPLNGRNATELIFLAGMATIGGNNGGFLNSVRNYPTVMIAVAGGQPNWTTYNWDGVNHNDAYNSLNLPLPFPDALQEFKVESSALQAQYGMHASATVNVVTKSGTNAYHGDAFEFLRNGDLNARDFFAVTRDTLKRNQFGGTIGGPVLPRLRDKLFFFAGYQGTILRSNPTASQAFVPTADMLAGDFTTFASPACQGGRQVNLSPTLGFVNNTISPSQFSPAALKIDALLPHNATPCGQVFFPLQNNSREDMGTARVDYQHSQKQSMYLRAFATNLDAPSTFIPGNALTLNTNGQHNRVYSIAFGDTYLFSASLINSFRFGGDRSEITKLPDNLATWPQLGVNAPFNPDTEPRVAVSGGNGFNIGGGNAIINLDHGGPNPNISDDVSWIKGSHQLSFGVQYLKTILNYQSGINATGLATFNGTISGLGLADFLLGNAVAWAQGNLQSYLYNRQNYLAIYAQDSWKANSRLTVNYGVRWEPFFAFTNKNGYFDHFDAALFAQNVHSTVYPNAPAGLIFPGDPQWTPGDHRIASNRWNVFLPRLGVVWDPKGDGKMTLRASVGTFTDRGALYSMSAMAQDVPYGTVISTPNVKLDNPWATYPGGNPLPLLLSKNLTFPAFSSYITDNLHWHPTWVNQFNLSFQRQIGNDWLLAANYVGMTVSHLITEGQINPAVYQGTGPCSFPASNVSFSSCGTTASTNYRRIFYQQNPAQGQYYGIVSVTDDGGTESYNGLFLSAQKRLSHGVSVLTNYTWSHCISDLWNGNPGNNGVSNVTPGNRRNDRGNCNLIDQRQLFNLSIVAQTPKFSGRMLRLLASDWQVSPIMKVKSAQNYTVTTGADVALNGETALQRPNAVAGVSPYVTNHSACPNAPCYAWANPAAFANPGIGTLGTVSIYSQKGPSVFQLDLALVRSFPIREKTQLQVRAEAFNLPNHLNPAVPGTGATPTGPATNNPASFNVPTDISGTSGLSGGDYRVVQFALKYVF